MVCKKVGKNSNQVGSHLLSSGQLAVSSKLPLKQRAGNIKMKMEQLPFSFNNPSKFSRGISINYQIGYLHSINDLVNIWF